MGAKKPGLFRKRNGGQVADSMRGADSSDLTSVKVNNEIAFCRVRSLEQKEEIEKLLLKNRISYFVKWQEHRFLGRIFSSDSKENTTYTICIHDTAVPQAKELIAEMQDVKLLAP